MCVPVLHVHRRDGVITHIGGSGPDLIPWGLTVDEAAALIVNREWDFFVEVPVGSQVPVLAKKSRGGKSFLTTSPDGKASNNLEALPDLPNPLAGVKPWFPQSIPGRSIVARTSVKDLAYRYKPSPSLGDPTPAWKDVHAGPFDATRHDVQVPREFWSGGSRMFRLAALLPFPANYQVHELLVFGTRQSIRPLERVDGDDIARRTVLEADGKGWWSWDLVLTKPDGTYDASKPSRLTEVRVSVRPSDAAWTHNDFVVQLEVFGINPSCAAYALVGLHFFTPPKVGVPEPEKCTLPKVVGLRLDQAFEALDPCKLDIYVIGNTSIETKESKVVAQSVDAGTMLAPKSDLILRVEPITPAATGYKELVVTNSSARAGSRDLWLFDYTVGGWTKKATVAQDATAIVPLIDKHSLWLVAVDPTNPECPSKRPDGGFACIAWDAGGPRLGASNGGSLALSIS
jgi:hypothetical protein